jgi:carboxymethylenebutenolidase
MAMATLPGARGEMPVYVAEPGGEGPWPGVLVISDALGMTGDLKNQAEWLAGEGFLAAAPDLYYFGGRIGCMFSTMRHALARQGPVFDDFETVRRWLADRPDCTGRIGVIGFCMGGGFALLLAGKGGYDASSVNYGTVPGDAIEYLADACPIVGSFGARDWSNRKAPELLERAATVNQIPHDVKVYPEAGHSFLNDHDPDDVPLWSLVAGRLVASEYHDPSARDARRRILAFFDQHLRQ